MSFSSDVKKEIIEHKTTKSCCVLSVCYAIACFGRYFDNKGIILHTEKVFIAQYAKAMYERLGINGKIFVKGTENKPIYEFAVKQPEDIKGFLKLSCHSGEETTLRINKQLFICDNCINSFLAAAFLCAGTITNPIKEYNLEYNCNRQNRMKDLQEILQEKGFSLKLTIRKATQVLYSKSSVQIEDLLVIMGAKTASFELMNQKIYKDFRNKANRMANCETANISKIVQANQAAIQAIEYLQSQDALLALPKSLVEAAKIRTDNPECSLAELTQFFVPPISKSGLSHRLKKIESISKILKEKKEQNKND